MDLSELLFYKDIFETGWSTDDRESLLNMLDKTLKSILSQMIAWPDYLEPNSFIS